MNNRRFGIAALLVCWLCIPVAAQLPPDITCALVETFDPVHPTELAWYNRNCVDDDDDENIEEPWRPPDNTCPHLPARVKVSGYNGNTQCQLVEHSSIGRSDLIQRGFIDAVDVWNFETQHVDVCFRYHGWTVFLDAAFAPRLATEMEHSHRDGMTCVVIDRPGTVVLLRSAALAETPATDAAPATLPTLEAIPLVDCQIKLVETLYLRAEPAGEIIGIVWLNSEVPAFEINGYWYRVEFEGVTGYISRFYRKVLHGGCG